MKIKLKFEAMSILMAGLQKTQMWAVYQMGMGNEMPLSVTKEDLTCIIAFLCKQLDWIDEGAPGQPSSCTTIESPISFGTQKSENQAANNSVKRSSQSTNSTVLRSFDCEIFPMHMFIHDLQKLH